MAFTYRLLLGASIALGTAAQADTELSITLENALNDFSRCEAMAEEQMLACADSINSNVAERLENANWSNYTDAQAETLASLSEQYAARYEQLLSGNSYTSTDTAYEDPNTIPDATHSAAQSAPIVASSSFEEELNADELLGFLDNAERNIAQCSRDADIIGCGNAVIDRVTARWQSVNWKTVADHTSEPLIRKYQSILASYDELVARADKQSAGNSASEPVRTPSGETLAEDILQRTMRAMSECERQSELSDVIDCFTRTDQQMNSEWARLDWNGYTMEDAQRINALFKQYAETSQEMVNRAAERASQSK